MSVKSLKDSIKNGKWDAARYALRFIADLVNCHVISAGSLLQLMDSFVDAALEEGVPQVIKMLFKYLERNWRRRGGTFNYVK